MAGLGDAEAYLKGTAYSGSGDWLDQSGNSHDGSFNGGVDATHDGERFFIDGVHGGGDYIDIADHANLDSNDTDFTVMIRVLVPTGEPNGNSVIVSKKPGLGSGAGWAIWGASLAGVNALCYDTASNGANVPVPTLSNDVIHVIAYRRNTTANEFHCFLDGSKGSTITDNQTDQSNGNPIRIGAEGGGWNNFGGYVYDFVYWTSALSDADVSAAGEALASATPTIPLLGVG